MVRFWWTLRAFALILLWSNIVIWPKTAGLSHVPSSFVPAHTVISSQKQTRSSCKPDVLIVILSDARQQWKRDAIRGSWAGSIQRLESEGKLAKGNLRYFFVVGRLRTQISANTVVEAKTHKDLIVADQNDYDYELYTSKMLWTLRWAADNCRFDILLKVNDDDFVNPLILMKKWLPSVSRGNLFRGTLVKNSRPLRDEDNPWYIPKEYFPWETYPEYPERSYALSRNMCTRLIELMTEQVEKIYYDDVAVAVALKNVTTVADDSTFVSPVRPGFTSRMCEGTVVLRVSIEQMSQLANKMLSSGDGRVC